MNFEVPLPSEQMFNVSGLKNEIRGLKNLLIFTYYSHPCSPLIGS